jgi:hypothetical protein
MFTIALEPKSVASHLRFIQSRMVQDSFLPIPISGRGGTDMTHPSFVMIFRDDIHSGSDCGMSANDLATPQRNLSGVPDQDVMPKNKRWPRT